MTIPLALHGVVVKADGTVVNVCIGEDPSDPVIYINDLLPHLAKDQSAKPLGSAFPAEGLTLLMGSRPYPGCEGVDAIRLNWPEKSWICWRSLPGRSDGAER